MKPAVRSTALSAAISLSLVQAAFADGDKNFATVVVTAQRSEQSLDQALASVTVLEREDIERSQAPDLLNLLSRQAGIDGVRTGGPGSASTINLRGSNSNHTLILIDGLRVNSAVQGLYDLAHLPLAQIERIEIVRGPRAALWGSDAIGGVIQIFTRRDGRPFAEARAGSYGRRGADAGLALGQGERHLNVAAGVDRLEGFSATNPDAGPYAYDPDHDGYRNGHGSLRFSNTIGAQRLSLSARFVDARNEYDQGASDVRDQQFGASLAGELGRNWSHELVIGRSRNEVRSEQPTYAYSFASERSSIDWLHRFDLAQHQRLQFGLNWSRESGRADDSFLGPNYDVDRRNTGVFAAWSGEARGQEWQLSVRRDDNSQFGATTTANAAWGWQVSAAVKLRASWGQGFRAPNFNELYYPGFFGYYGGNPELEPERSQSVEAGLNWRIADGHRLGVSAYRTRVRDLVAFEGEPYSTAINIARAHLDGVELDYGFERGAWRFAANASWQRAENADTGDRLLRRAPRKAHASLDYAFGNGLQLGLDADLVAARPDLDFNQYPAAAIDLAGYGLVHLRASMPIGSGWSAEARLENLGDRDYTLVQGFNTPGRSGLLTLRWTGD